MSREFSTYFGRSVMDPEVLESRDFKRFGYGWQSPNIEISGSQIQARNDLESYGARNDLPYNQDPFVITVPGSVSRRSASVTLVSIKRTVSNVPVPSELKMQQLRDKFGEDEYYNVKSDQEADVLLATHYTGRDFVNMSISVGSLKIIEDRIPEVEENYEEFPLVRTLERMPIISVNEADEVTELASPFFFVQNDDVLCWEPLALEDNIFLLELSREFSISYDFLLGERARGSSLIQTFEVLRVDVPKYYWDRMLERDRVFPSKGILMVAEKLKVTSSSLIGGIYLRAAIMGKVTEHEASHPFWLLLSGSNTILFQRNRSISLYFGVHRALATGYVKMPIISAPYSWAHACTLLNKSGFVFAPGGFAVAKGNFRVFLGGNVGLSADVSILFGNDTDWCTIYKMLSYGNYTRKERERLVFLKRRDLGAFIISGREALKIISSESFFPYVMLKYFESPVIIPLTVYRYSGIDMPIVGRVLNRGEFWTWKLSARYGGCLPHELVERIVYFIQRSYVFVTTSLTLQGDWRGSSIPYLNRLSIDLGRYDHEDGYVYKSRCNFNYRPGPMIAGLIKSVDARDGVVSVGGKGKYYSNKDVCVISCSCWLCQPEYFFLGTNSSDDSSSED